MSARASLCHRSRSADDARRMDVPNVNRSGKLDHTAFVQRMRCILGCPER